ncbi:putative Ig domain-containing protein [Dyadobacter sp.]|uniref:putative Ig domain-containing protein n=1 Tax=Dyadobacter sp. TaxID=1914288 RepID=UPI003F71526E
MTTRFQNHYLSEYSGRHDAAIFSDQPGSFKVHAGKFLVFMLSLLMLAQAASAQQSNLVCNDQTNFSAPTFSNLTVTTTVAPNSGGNQTTVANTSNLTDNDPATFAEVTLRATRSGTLCGTATNASGVIRVESPSGTTYQRGNYVGFITSNDLADFASVNVAATLNGTSVSSTSTPIISQIGSNLYEVGFVTTGSGSFNGIEISLTLDAQPILAGCGTVQESVNIYNAFQVNYCTAPSFPVNIAKNASLPDFNVTTSSSGGDPLEVLLVGGIVNDANAISRSTTDYAQLVQVLGKLGTKYLQVHDNVTTYPSGTFAGFDISTASTLQVGLLSDITIETRLNGNVVDSETGAGLVVSGELLSAGTRKTIGFTSAGPFNEIRIVFNGLGLLVGETRIYNAVVQRFEEGTALACNTPTQLTSPAYPLTVSLTNTGLSGTACVACSISDQNNVIDADVNTAATINVLAAVGAEGSISVKKEGISYQAGTFAGFSVGNAQLVGLSLFKNITITTYLDGEEQESQNGTGGLINVGLLTGSRQTVGFVTNEEFDEIRITVEQTADVTSTTLVYGPVITNFCNDGALTCNTPVNVTNPSYAVFVNAANTAINSALCANCQISETQAVVDGSSTDDYASINLAAAVGNIAGFSVKNAITDYPAGTYAGFDILTGSLLNVDALAAIRIRTYLNGVETAYSAGTGYTGTALLVGAGLLTSSGRQTVGVVAEDAFDEIKIEFTNLASVPLGTVRIYNAVVQQMCNNNPIVCGTTGLLVAPAQPVVVESSRTGLVGVCALCEVQDANNVITASTSDYAVLRVPAGVAGSASISVKNGVVTYGAGTVAGFTIQDLQGIVSLDLLQSLTLSTYLNGQPTGETASGNTLIALRLLLPLIGNGTESDIYNVNFTATQPFDEIRLSVNSLAGLLNLVRVYGAFVTPFADGCLTPGLVFNEIPYNAYVAIAYNSVNPVSVATYTGEGETYSVVSGTGFNRLPPGLSIDPNTGIISGSPDENSQGIYTFLVEVRDSNGNRIGQRTYRINVQDNSLPVTLASFNATAEGITTSLSWATSEESNSDRFDVERSQNGKVWSKIGSVKSAQESKGMKYYNFTDNMPAGGMNYYRLKMVDLDESFAYSQIKEVKFGSTSFVSPNPVRSGEMLKITLTDWSKVKQVQVINAAGKVVFESANAFSAGINTTNLSTGSYIVKVIQLDGNVSTHRFVKQ